nr:small glutamine-rich tetratricopeptide repeat-containing protein 2 [Quercus suber]
MLEPSFLLTLAMSEVVRHAHHSGRGGMLDTCFCSAHSRTQRPDAARPRVATSVSPRKREERLARHNEQSLPVPRCFCMNSARYVNDFSDISFVDASLQGQVPMGKERVDGRIAERCGHRSVSKQEASATIIAMADTSHKRLALAIIDFLSTSLKDGTLQAEDGDSIEVAQNCIAEAFHVDANDRGAIDAALGGQNLLSIFGVYEKLKQAGPAKPSSSGSTTTTPATAGASSEEAKGGPTEESEKLKGQGNAAMQKKDYTAAVELYTRALAISPLNPIYLSNRAAAYSAGSQHEFARNDAELATATDPKYTKAWSRLGLARFALGDAKGSMEAYQKGIEAEGNGGSEAMKKGFETARRRVEEESGVAAAQEVEEETARGGGGGGRMPDLSSLAGMFGGGGGGGGAGGGGMPDLSALMQNPMMRQMAQNVMSNPDMMNNIMNNPQLRNMASRFGGGGAGASPDAQGGGGGGGMPDLSAMMNDPSIAEMARSFMGGMGGGAGAGRGGGGGGGAGGNP